MHWTVISFLYNVELFVYIQQMIRENSATWLYVVLVQLHVYPSISIPVRSGKITLKLGFKSTFIVCYSVSWLLSNMVLCPSGIMSNLYSIKWLRETIELSISFLAIRFFLEQNVFSLKQGPEKWRTWFCYAFLYYMWLNLYKRCVCN